MNQLENVRCEVCGEILPISLTEEHHKVHRALGGNDKKSNLIRICVKCHKMVHIIFKNMKSRKPKDENYNKDFLRKAKYSDRSVQIIMDLAKQAWNEFVKRDMKMGGKKYKAISLEFTQENLNMITAASERNGYKSPKNWIESLIIKNAGIRR